MGDAAAAFVEGVAGEGRSGGRNLGAAAGRPGDILVGWIDGEVVV